jgi:hypothetical protein
MPFVYHKPEKSPWPQGYTLGANTEDSPERVSSLKPGERAEVSTNTLKYLTSTFPAHFVEAKGELPPKE